MDLKLAAEAIRLELQEKKDPQLNAMLGAVIAVDNRNGDVHDIFEIEAVNFGLKLADRHRLRTPKAS